MDVVTPEGLAMEAMMGKNVDVPKTASATLSDVTLALRTTPATEKVTPLNIKNVKTIVSHVAFRLTFVFLMTFAILVAINPPFVQVRNTKKNPIEASPCSYGRAMVVAAIVTLLVGAIPQCIKHKDKFASVFSKIKGWTQKGSAL